MQAAGDLPPPPPPPTDNAAGLTDDECLRRIRSVLPLVSAAFVSASAQKQRAQHGYCHAGWCDFLVGIILDGGTYPRQQSPVAGARGPEAGAQRTRKRPASTGLSDYDEADDGHDGGKPAGEAAAIEHYKTSNSHETRTVAIRREIIALSLSRKSLFDAYVTLYHYNQSMIEKGKIPRDARDDADLSEHLTSDGTIEDELLAAKKYVRGIAGAASQAHERPEKKQRTEKTGPPRKNVDTPAEKQEELPRHTCFCCGDDECIAADILTCNGSRRHTYCHTCIVRYVQVEVQKRNARIGCFMGPECEAPFLPAQLAACVDAAQLRQLAELEQDAEIAAAGLDNMHSCPSCNFRAQCPPLDETRQFDCPGCGKASCRLCLKRWHPPLTCAQFETEQIKEDKIKLLHVVEEAMSKALIRRCNKCGTAFIKEMGCNRVWCSNHTCRNQQCYICGVDINGYTHFGPSSCPLHDNDVPLNVRHEREVKVAEDQTVAMLVAKHPEIPAAEFREMVSKQMKKKGTGV